MVQMSGNTCKMDRECFYFSNNTNSPSAEEVSNTNGLLAQVVDDVLQISAAPKKRPETLRLPKAQLKLAFVGKPFSGKTTMAKEIAEKYQLKVIVVQDIIKDVLL